MKLVERIPPTLYPRLLGVAQRITAQRDISRLCETILEEAQAMTNADGGTLYLVDGYEERAELNFAIIRNHSLGITMGGARGKPIQYPPLPMYENGKPNHANIATHAGLDCRLVNIADAYNTDEFDFSGTRAFDEKFGYRSRSILAVPLTTETGELVGVLQLLNATDPESGNSQVFPNEIEPVVELLASFAAIAIAQQRIMHDQKELLVELSGEPNTGRLLERILTEAQVITHSDGGSLYLLRDDDEGGDRLEFALVRNDTLGIKQGGTDGQEITIDPIPLQTENGQENHNNIAAHAALSGQVINIEDAYQSDQFDFSGTKAFDEKYGYRSTSFLTIPLMNHLDEVIGVLQLVNARHPRTDEVIPFSEQVEPVVRALSSYAAIALNNLILVQELKNLLDAFIKVIAQAIDAKSPHTSAHCQRVPMLTELIARAACEDKESFADFNLNDDEWYELHVAAWMHDCGKLATPDSVLDKSTKLHTLYDRIETVATRFQALKQQARIEMLEKLLDQPDQEEQIRQRYQQEIEQLDDDLTFIRGANKGGEFMEEERKERVARIAQKSWIDADGNVQPLLTEDEVYNLCIERGTLTHEERQVINNHMVVTIDMLESLPFPRKLRRVPEYAGGHHEKMDGSGFPRGLTREQMSWPARMMAIADIFEALTSRDRPYKDPMKISQSLSILRSMRDNNHIDPDLYELFVRSRVWEKYAQQALDDEQLDVQDPSAYL